MAQPKPALMLFTVLVPVSMALNCQEDTARVEAVKGGKEILAIKPSSTMPKEMAEKIMWFYFLHNISGCGFPSEPVDEGEYWTSIPRVGDVGQADKNPIRLHKRSGRISWGQGPSFDSLMHLAILIIGPMRGRGIFRKCHRDTWGMIKRLINRSTAKFYRSGKWTWILKNSDQSISIPIDWGALPYRRSIGICR